MIVLRIFLGMSLSDDEVKKGNVLKGIQNWVAMLNLRETLLLENTKLQRWYWF